MPEKCLGGDDVLSGLGGGSHVISLWVNYGLKVRVETLRNFSHGRGENITGTKRNGYFP